MCNETTVLTHDEYQHLGGTKLVAIERVMVGFMKLHCVSVAVLLICCACALRGVLGENATLVLLQDEVQKMVRSTRLYYSKQLHWLAKLLAQHAEVGSVFLSVCM